MHPLLIEADENITPAVILDSTKNVFEIGGWSHPEDAVAFYKPVLEWLSQYEVVANAETAFHFKFQYYNTASSKQIFKIISVLEKIATKNKVTIFWYYDEEDTDMLVAGERFSQMINVPFKFVIAA